MNTLIDAIEYMKATSRAHEQACATVWAILESTFPEVREVIAEWPLPPDRAITWFCSKHFDHRTKSAAELFCEGRGEEVLTQIRQAAHGMIA